MSLWSYQHVPEDDVAAGRFTAAQDRQAWRRISGPADSAGNPHLRPTLILMGWTPAYYPCRAVIEVLGCMAEGR